ncbi:RipA family octameric membrane protein [Candidatus Palauibacter irciniicola]|uniref:RipA family octameric membrane protein n=1 Tax=Candidatus Palauibacter irciniicola TaxID=3056733 RepID=UPI003B0115DE
MGELKSEVGVRESERELLFETYKLHTELAERVASLREDVNKLYVSMTSGVIAASVLLQKLVQDGEATWVLPVLGVTVTVSWMSSLHSVTGRLSGKHHALVELESKLGINFFTREREEFERGRFLKRKHTALVLPGTFFLVCVGWLVVMIL